MSVRDVVFNALCEDPALTALGYDRDSLYPVYSRDTTPESIEGKRFGILRWGPAEIGVGSNRPLNLEVWLYHRDPDYDPILAALARCEVILKALPGQPCGNGWINDVAWAGSSADLNDDLYGAYVRSESYRIVTSSK